MRIVIYGKVTSFKPKEGKPSVTSFSVQLFCSTKCYIYAVFSDNLRAFRA